MRNVLVAIGNSEDASLLPIIAPLQQDSAPLVAEMALWAMKEFGSWRLAVGRIEQYLL